MEHIPDDFRGVLFILTKVDPILCLILYIKETFCTLRYSNYQKKIIGARFMKKLSLMLIAAVLSAFILEPAAVYAAELPASWHTTEEELSVYPATRDQDPSDKGWGACWSFAATALAEFDAVTNLGATSDIDLSEMALIYDTYYPSCDPIGFTYGDTTSFSGTNFLKYGGSMDFAIWTMTRWSGLAAEWQFPYTLDTFEAITSGTAARGDAYQDQYHLESAYSVSSSDTAALKSLIMEHGAVGMSYYSGNKQDKNGTVYYNKDHNSYCFLKGVYEYTTECDCSANHAIAVVGWDDSFSAKNFTYKPQGDGAWLVRNSWSSESGFTKDSYFWLSYYDESIGASAYAVSMAYAGKYDNNYQYDGGVFTNTKLKSLDSTVSANVFQAVKSDTESLRAVAIAPTGPCDYTISIYTGLLDREDPESGDPVAEVFGSTAYGGFITVPLDSPVSLKFGEYFSVIVDLDGAKMSCEYGKESVYSGDKNLGVSCGISAGESFYLQDDEYVDLTKLQDSSGKNLSAAETGYGYGNFRIKAYTDNTGTGVLPAVKKLSASSVTKSSVKLTWSESSGAAGYYVYRTDKGGKSTQIKVIDGADVTTFTNKKLSANTSYKYSVCAFYKVGDRIYTGSPAKLTVKTKK